MPLADPTNAGQKLFQVGTPLSSIIESLGTDIIRHHVLVSDELTSSVELYDAQAAESTGQGVLLGIISAQSLRDDELRRAVAAAAENGCAGVVVRATGAEPPKMFALAREAGLSALALANTISWREFDALITRLLGEQAPSLQLAPSTGDKLFALANTIARVYGGSVAIEDHQRGILAHSAIAGQAIDELRTRGILDRRAGDAPVNEDRYRQVLAAEGPVSFSAYRNFLPRVAIAVRAGSIPLGTIWALNPEGVSSSSLSSEKHELIEQAASLVGSYLLESWRTASLSVLPREEAFKRMLAGNEQRGDTELVDTAESNIGVIIVLTVAKGSQTSVQIAEIQGVLRRHLGVYVPDVLSTVIGREIIVLCPVETNTQIRQWVVRALNELQPETRTRIRAGLSQPHPIRSHLPYAVAEAREIAALADSTHSQIPELGDVRPQLFLAACQRVIDQDERLILPEIEKLLEHRERNLYLAETFDCWLQEVGNVGRTAQRLRVHEQTVRYRLRKVSELIDIDLTTHTPIDPTKLLSLWLQIRLLMNQGQPDPHP